MDDWFAELERVASQSPVFLASVFEKDPRDPNNRDQRIDTFSWSMHDNSWINNATGEPAETEQNQMLAFLVAQADAFGLARVRGRWDTDGDEPRLLLRRAQLAIGGSPRLTNQVLQSQVLAAVNEGTLVDLSDGVVTLYFSDDLARSSAESDIKIAMDVIARASEGSGLMNAKEWE